MSIVLTDLSVSVASVNHSDGLSREHNLNFEQKFQLAQKVASKYSQYVEDSFGRIIPPKSLLKQGVLTTFAGIASSGGSERNRTAGERAFDFLYPLNSESMRKLPVPTQINQQVNASAQHYSKLTDTQKYFWDKWTTHEFEQLGTGAYSEKEFRQLLEHGLDYLVHVLAP